jgi:hypothetical protein
VAPNELQCAAGYANRLLADLGESQRVPPREEAHPARRWAHSGAMALTGYPGEPAQMCPVPLASYADGVIAALDCLCPDTPLATLDGARLLGERAALSGAARGGDVSAGGACRLLPAADGWLAVNLPRPSDWQVLPAWLESGAVDDWSRLAHLLKARTVGECLARGRELGLAVAGLTQPVAEVPWCAELVRVPAPPAGTAHAPLVVDLSSLWAGPLCSQLLHLMGARVVKLESSARPDGQRQAPGGFFDLLNAGKASVTLDLTRSQAREQLRRLLLRADIVIEASRPRALRQLGVIAEDILADNRKLTWIAISGHGRGEPEGNWVAFGDDGAVAGGLSQVLWDTTGRAMFCADAIADPLTGLHAALAAWSSFAAGGGRLLSLALRDVTAHCRRFAGLEGADAGRELAGAWQREVRATDVAMPVARPITARARPLGADTAEVLSALDAGY